MLTVTIHLGEKLFHFRYSSLLRRPVRLGGKDKKCPRSFFSPLRWVFSSAPLSPTFSLFPPPPGTGLSPWRTRPGTCSSRAPCALARTSPAPSWAEEGRTTGGSRETAESCASLLRFRHIHSMIHSDALRPMTERWFRRHLRCSPEGSLYLVWGSAPSTLTSRIDRRHTSRADKVLQHKACRRQGAVSSIGCRLGAFFQRQRIT